MSDPLTIIHGDALTALASLDIESVQTCVTSPPYWGLRDYGTATWSGGDADCDHVTGRAARAITDASKKQSTNSGSWATETKDVCGKCGARRIDIQVGLEKTPEQYVARLVEIFREVRRALRPDGTVWLNLGDSYGTGTTAVRKQGARGIGANTQEAQDAVPRCGGMAKQLIGIPWRVAFALQSDGWYLRSDIIWSKPNPMPESVRDRPTKSHEYLFLLSKSERYYYDADSIKEPGTWPDGPNAPDKIKSPYGQGFSRKANEHGSTLTGGAHGRHYLGEAIPAKQRRSDKQRGHSRRHAGFNDRWDAMEREQKCSGMRNKRSVWTIATRPFPDAHFATFPVDLVEPCILAGAPVGGVVLDPFAGSGTTGKVAIELGRKAILIEPKAEYVEMIKRRCQTTIGLPLAI